MTQWLYVPMLQSILVNLGNVQKKLYGTSMDFYFQSRYCHFLGVSFPWSFFLSIYMDSYFH